MKTKDYAQLRAIKPWQGRGQQMELSGAGKAAHSTLGKHTAIFTIFISFSLVWFWPNSPFSQIFLFTLQSFCLPFNVSCNNQLRSHSYPHTKEEREKSKQPNSSLFHLLTQHTQLNFLDLILFKNGTKVYRQTTRGATPQVIHGPCMMYDNVPQTMHDMW